MKSYLRFERAYAAETGKTQVWRVYNDARNIWLGDIAWFSRWRQYAFFPTIQIVLNAGCLHEIETKVRDLMAERKL